MNTPQEHKDLTPRSAGRLMVSKVPVIHPGATIAGVERLLLEKTKKLETINYIYVVDREDKLLGVLSVKEVFRAPKETPVEKIMTTKLITARPHTDQERIALLAIEHSIKEVPVVDHEDRFLGVVPDDVILNVLHQENIEDVLRFAGIHDPTKETIKADAATLIRKRLPWLLVGLLGGLIAVWVVNFFEQTLEVQIILASFIPAIVYMADAVGTQTQTIFIRTLAIDRHLKILSYLGREIKVGLGISVFMSVLMGILAYLFWEPNVIALILGFSFLATIMVAIGVAVFLPWFFTKLKIDPAIASGPFATIIRDILSLFIYFWIATFILEFAL